MSQSVASIHDAFCKQAIGDPVRAKRFLREHLPPPLAARLSDQPPELLPVSFVDEGLRQHHSDLLFRVGLKTGGDAFVYMLIEHKSAPDPLARLQLLRYTGEPKSPSKKFSFYISILHMTHCCNGV